MAWNSELDDMLCFSGNGVLKIKTGTFPVHQQKMPGVVVGFSGSRIFVLHEQQMQTVDVPQGASLYRYLEAKQYRMASKVACLGVTDADWRLLATEALRAMQFDIAREAFIRVRDMRAIDLLYARPPFHLLTYAHTPGNRSNDVEARRASEGDSANDDLYLAEVLAHQGHYEEASRAFSRANAVDKAVQMYTDLRMWEAAKQVAANAEESGIDVAALSLKQAEAAEQVRGGQGREAGGLRGSFHPSAARPPIHTNSHTWGLCLPLQSCAHSA